MTEDNAFATVQQRLKGKTAQGHPLKVQRTRTGFTVRTATPHHDGRGFHVADGAWHDGLGRYYVTGTGSHHVRPHIGSLGSTAARSESAVTSWGGISAKHLGGAHMQKAITKHGVTLIVRMTKAHDGDPSHVNVHIPVDGSRAWNA